MSHQKLLLMQQSKVKKDHDFISLFEKFISESKRDKRLQPNGKKISEGTIKNYISTKNLLLKFCAHKKFKLRIREERKLNQRETQTEQNYWKKFYKKFTDYLYNDLGYFDNYVGNNIKNLKTFFNYLNKETVIKVGNFHKLFYVRKEEIGVFTLMPEELNFLIFDRKFEENLSKRMQEVKDVFIFGCTVALRVSDLLALKRSSIRVVNQQHYLAVRSQKSGIDTLIKLPSYCIDVIAKYRKRNTLLPKFNKSNLNRYIKLLLEKAGFTQEILLKREKRGRSIVIKPHKKNCNTHRFCDVASTHMMRRTAITTMLCLGMPEQVVRKISGHASGSKEFYRYVLWAQTYLDQESEKVFQKLKEKELRVA